MKILYIYKDYYPVLGGIENHARQLAEGMAARGHEVEVLVTNPGKGTLREQSAGVKITKASRITTVASTPLSFTLPLELYRRRFAANPPDIIHLHSPYPVGEFAWLVGSYLPRFGKKRPGTVLYYHSDVIRQRRLLTFYGPILKRVLRRLDVIVASSPNYIKSSPFLSPLATKCQVIPLGVDTARFGKFDPAAVKTICQRYTTESDEVLLLFTGRLRYYKGLQYLVEAMPQVSEKAKLLIIGIGPMEQQLKEQVARLKLNERVTFWGEVSDAELSDYYAASDVFILPSCERSEAYGLVQLEAMAAGKPVVSTELGTGTSYVNLNGETGLVVPPADPPALAHAINELVADPEWRKALGERGQSRTRAEFSLETMLDEMEKLYIRLSSGPA